MTILSTQLDPATMPDGELIAIVKTRMTNEFELCVLREIATRWNDARQLALKFAPTFVGGMMFGIALVVISYIVGRTHP
jgi:hypothetical protein